MCHACMYARQVENKATYLLTLLGIGAWFAGGERHWFVVIGREQ